ncbi:MAG: hypothetical protein ACFE0O_01410 [Opitutales bacterium]
MAKKATTQKSTTKKSVVKKTPAKKTAARKKAAKKTVAKKTPVKQTAPEKKGPTRKSDPARPSETTVSARADVGFGNTLYLRGEGGGLSWDSGVAMDNTASDQWIWSTASGDALTFKFLINDTHWCIGEDYTVPAGGSTTEFPSWD